MTAFTKTTTNYPQGSDTPIHRVKVNHAPTATDIKNFNLGDEWIDTSSSPNGTWWKLSSKASGGLIWVRIGGNTGEVETLTGNSGLAVGPDSSANINILGDTTTVNIVGNPGTNTLTVSTTGTVANLYTENTGTAAPSSNNLNVVGTATNGINTTGSGSTVTVAMHSPYADGDFDFQSTTGGQTRTLTVENTSNTASSQATQNIKVAGTSAGDAWTQWTVGASRSYGLGISNSASQDFNLRTNNSGSVSPTTGNLLLNYDLALNRFLFNVPLVAQAVVNIGNLVDFNIQNQDNTNGASDVRINIQSGGASGGDPYLVFTTTGTVPTYTLGKDVSDSEKLKIVLNGTSPSTGTTAWVMTNAGIITEPLQPSFLAYLSGTVTNKTGNGTTYTLGTDALTKVYDRATNFNTNGTFTAPVTGIYDLRSQITVSATTIATTFVIAIVTTARTYQYTFTKAAGNQTETVSISALADMSATNTATTTITVSGEAADTDSISGGATLVSYFCGTLVA